MKLAPFVLLLAPFQAFAGGFYFADSGVVAAGRGGAFVAGADTQFAQYYNPAGLIRIKRPTINVGMSGVGQTVDFTRHATGDDPSTEENEDALHEFDYPTVKNEGGLFAIPEFGFVAPVHKMVAVGFGMTSGFAPKYRFDPEGPQRFTIVETGIFNFQVGPSVAVQPIKYVTIGASFQWQILRVQEDLVVTTAPNENPSGDVGVRATVWDKFTPSFNVGLLVEPIPQLSIGFCYQPQVKFRAKGEGSLDFSKNGLTAILDHEVWTDDDISLALDMPTFIKSGVAVRPVPQLEVEADFIYEAWSSLKSIEVTDIDVTLTTSDGSELSQVPETISLPAGFNDSWSVRLGGEYQVHPMVEVRAGAMYESSSLPSSGVTVALVDTKKVVASAGTSVHLIDDQLVIDAYGSIAPYQSLSITDSTAKPIYVGLMDPPPVMGSVGNGELKSLGFSFGGALRWQIGKASKMKAKL